MTGLPSADLRARLQFATRIAQAVGQRLSRLRASGRWSDPSMLGDVGDQAADGFLQGALRAGWPDDGVLSEETDDDAERRTRRCTWIVDPLDGTKEYGAGREDWAVHVGLAVAGAPVLGVVALPAIDRTFAATLDGDGALPVVLGTAGGWPRHCTAATAESGAAGATRLRLVVSRSHPPDWATHLADDLDAELLPCGSVGFKVAQLLFGRADAYVHEGGLKEWDTCAPEVVARAAGWSVVRLDGALHRYNRADPRNDTLLVSRPEVLPALLAATARARGR